MQEDTEKEEIKRLLKAVSDQGEQNKTAIEQNRTAIEKNRASTDRNGADIAFLLQCMNEGHRQIIRHIDMRHEEILSENRAFRDGMVANRERPDDHEIRIDDLESAS
jgi:uncharacterized membrane-anchored protein YhcB (DUF1043 family)